MVKEEEYKGYTIRVVIRKLAKRSGWTSEIKVKIFSGSSVRIQHLLLNGKHCIFNTQDEAIGCSIVSTKKWIDENLK